MTVLLPGSRETNLSPRKPVFARDGWEIPQKNLAPENPALVRLRADSLMKERRGLTLRSLSNFPYNCMGMIFASRRAWIDIDKVIEVLRHDGYRRIDRHEVMQGDIVLYKDHKNTPSHVALIVMAERRGSSINIQVISKWGLDAEFIHFVEDVTSNLGEPAEFYTDRKTT